MKKKTITSLSLLLAGAFLLQAQFGGAEAARPRIETRVVPASGTIDFHFRVPAGYHITDLKNNFFAISLPANEYAAVSRVAFPAGVPYGEESVFKGEFSVRVFLKTLKVPATPVKLDFDVSYQVCQEYPEELCYPPDQSRVQVEIGPDLSPAGGASVPGDEPLARRLENLIRGRLNRASFLLFVLVSRPASWPA
jgi:hypothetical protein